MIIDFFSLTIKKHQTIDGFFYYDNRLHNFMTIYNLIPPRDVVV